MLHVTQTTITGTARVVADLAVWQRALGWDVRVACPAGGPLVRWLQAAGIEQLSWDASRQPGPATAGEAVRLRSIVRRVDPNLLHLHSSKAGLVGRAVVRGTRPTIFQPHGWSFAAIGGTARRAAVGWERTAARWADVVLCVSQAERCAGAGAGVTGRWRVVPNGVDLTRFVAGDAAARDGARQRLRLGTGPIVVCVGRISHQKGQDLLMAAWSAVRNAVPGARAFLVGGGSLELPGPPPPGVVLVGEQDDVTGWLHAADVVVAPSRWEGMALSVLEAMASARSVVAAEVEGMREALGDGGAGSIVPPADPGALARAIIPRLLDRDRADSEGRASRRRVEGSFDVRRSLDAVTALSIEVVDARPQLRPRS